VHEEANECTPFGKIGYHKTLVLDPISSDANIQNIKYDSKRVRLGPGQETILYRAGYFLTWSGGQTGHLSSRVGALEHLFVLRLCCGDCASALTRRSHSVGFFWTVSGLTHPITNVWSVRVRELNFSGLSGRESILQKHHH
jgi:hypothetical protein